MLLDTVHDVQRAYRALVQASASPGTIVNVGDEASRVDLDAPLARPLLLLAIMLIDAEVGFCMCSTREESDAALIAQLTYSRSVPVAHANFIIVPTGDSSSHEDRIAWTIARAHVGTLLAPHTGATVIAEVTELTAAAAITRGNGSVTSTDRATCLELTGPGIPTSCRVIVSGASNWLGARAQANMEYPLGVDMILVTAAGELVSLPRTTHVEWRER